MSLDCVGFGALNVDRLYNVERIARLGEETFVTDSKEYLGGSAANTVIGLARLGHKVGYVGKLGNDEAAKSHIHSFLHEGVDTHGIVQDKRSRSGLVLGFIDQRGERTLYVDPGVNDTLDFEEVNQEYAASAKFVHMTSFVGDRPFRAQLKLLEARPSIQVSFDPGEIYARKGLQVMRPFLKRSRVVFPNEGELRILTGEGPEQGAKTLLREGAGIVAVKLGERGCFVTDGKDSSSVPVFKVGVVDTTGAGDAFCAGFLHGLIAGKDIYECAKLGNLVASKKLTKPGAREGLPSLEDIEPEPQPTN